MIEIVKNTPVENRPLIDKDGAITHMNDDQFLEYLQKQEEMEQLPSPSPTDSQRITDLEAQNAELRRMIEALANGDTGVTA